MKIKGVLLAAVLCISGNVCAETYGGGSGTVVAPYQIWTPQQMNLIGANSGDWGKCFKLMADIDMSIYTGTQYKIIGNSTTLFTGSFDGNSKIISYLTINAPTQSCVGLFSYVGIGGQILNLGVENVNVTGLDYVGGLCGRNQGTISQSYVSGVVTWLGSGYAGGLCGSNYGTISQSYASSMVTGGPNVPYVGGLAGANNGTLTCCYATGSITNHYDTGGLVGWNNFSGTTIGCFWDMETSGQSFSAGGTGKLTTQMKSLLTFVNAGWADKGWVMNDGVDYPRLAWENTDGIPIPQPQAIPLVGSGTTDDPYLISTAQEFALLSWYPDVLDKQIKLTDNLDLSGVIIYPIGFFTGVFDGNDNTISNAAINQSNGYVGLFSSVGSGGHIRYLGIENVNITSHDCVVGGLVGRSSGTLTSCYVTGSVQGTDHYVGGLVGWNSGTLATCYATASVTGTGDQYSPVGGLVGYNNGTLTFCYASGSVTGTDIRVGGLVGDNLGTPTACFWDFQTSGQSNGVGSGSSSGITGKTTTEMQILSTFTSAGWDFVDVWGIGNNQTYPYLKSLTKINTADINYSGIVDMEDLAILAANWLKGE